MIQCWQIGVTRVNLVGVPGVCKDSVYTCLQADNSSKITGVSAEKHCSLERIKKIIKKAQVQRWLQL